MRVVREPGLLHEIGCRRRLQPANSQWMDVARTWFMRLRAIGEDVGKTLKTLAGNDGE